MQQRALEREQMHTLMTSGFRVFNLAAKLQVESLRFLGKRMEEYVKTSEELRQCKNPADVLDVQTNFFLHSLSDYQTEVDKMITGFLDIQKPVQQAIETALQESTNKES
jgi:hypothetical protein